MKQIIFTTQAAIRTPTKTKFPTFSQRGHWKPFSKKYPMKSDWFIVDTKNSNSPKVFARNLQTQNNKIVYCLCEATKPAIPFYVGETNNPGHRIFNHQKEVSSNTTKLTEYQNKCNLLERCNNEGIQVVLIPLLQVPCLLSEPYEVIIRCLFTELKFPLTNSLTLTNDVERTLRGFKLSKFDVYPFMFELLSEKSESASKTFDLFLEHIE